MELSNQRVYAELRHRWRSEMRGGHHGMHLTDVNGVARAVLSSPDKGAANYIGYIV